MSQVEYRALMGAAVAVNYWGELLTWRLLDGLLERPEVEPWRALLEGQRDDEIRHTAQTRALLVGWGQDPEGSGAVTDFTFHDVFMDFAGRDALSAMACVGENEALSARHFSQLSRIARTAGDPEVVALYREIMADEVSHSRAILAALPQTPAVAAARQEARERMEAALSEPYLRLYLRYPPPGRRR